MSNEQMPKFVLPESMLPGADALTPELLLKDYARCLADNGTVAAIEALGLKLDQREPAFWIQMARELWRRGAHAATEAILLRAVTRFPGNSTIALECARILRERGRPAVAESVLRGALGEPQDPDVLVLLADLIRDRGNFESACEMLRSASEARPGERNLRNQVCRFLEESDRKVAAFELHRRAIAGGDPYPEDLANAGRLAIQIGRFELAREYYSQAILRGLDVGQWQVAEALAMCQRYVDPDDVDLVKFQEWLKAPGLHPPARASLLFALGKAADDLRDYASAAQYWREANQLMRTVHPWRPEPWRKRTDQCLNESLPRGLKHAERDWTPIFIVGLPRSGTTLLAERLGMDPAVRNRGELMWIPQLADSLAGTDAPRDEHALQDSAAYYARMLRQDDAPARWYIDKQTFNFLHLGLIAALFPSACIIHCVRNLRDTALSIWSQHFGGANAAFSYSFEGIAEVSAGCERLMAHWRRVLPTPIHTVHYEALVSDPQQVLERLRRDIGMEESGNRVLAKDGGRTSQTIATASMWQARQPIHTGSVGRWRPYAEHVPELLSHFSE